MLRSIVYRRSLIGRVLAVLLAVLGSARLGVGIFAWRAANVLERPDYTVIRKLPGGVELRRYAAYTIAETAVKTSSMREASSTGFRTVAGYIFGKNKPSEKMRMTAPVRMSTSGGEAMAMTSRYARCSHTSSLRGPSADHHRPSSVSRRRSKRS